MWCESLFANSVRDGVADCLGLVFRRAIWLDATIRHRM